MAHARAVRTGVGVAVLLTLMASACTKADGPETAGAAAPGSTTSPVERPAGPPRQGGSIVVGLDAETNDYNPASGQWSPSSYAVANAVFDPLVAFDDKGDPRPYLAQAIEGNATFTEWVFRLRPSVTFHDGTPVNAAAVKRNIENVKKSPLTGQAFVAIDAIDATDELTVTVKMNRPWATFPATLSTQAGYVLAPSMLDDPEGANAKLVGSGPFTFVDRQRDTTVRTRRNAGYWQKDKAGTALPYLDGLQFQIITDPSAKANSLSSHDIDASTAGGTATSWKATEEQAARGELQRLTNEKAEEDEVILALNTTKEPFDDPVARQALAYGTDQIALADTVSQGAIPGAWGMFRESSPYYITPEEAGYPKHDVEKARQLVAEYERNHGKPLEFTTLAPTAADALATLQVIQADMASYGVKMNISAVEATKLISNVIVSGDYQASVFVLWSSPTADQGYVFIATPAKANGISLNFTRYDDPAIVAALDEFRATGDPRARIDAMKKVQKQLAKNLNMLFLSHSRTAWVYNNNIHGFTAPVLPGTDVKVYNPYPTTPFYTYVWRDA